VTLPDNTGRLTQKVSVDETTAYSMWIRQISDPAALDKDSVVVQVDDQCPVIAGDKVEQSGFVWVGHESGDPANQLQFNLSKGEHTIIVAGREPGVGIDRVMLTANLLCAPESADELCSADTDNNSTTSLSQSEDAPLQAATVNHVNWPVVLPCALIVLGTIGFLVWKYLAFAKLAKAHNAVFIGGLPGTGKPQSLFSQFLSGQKRLVFIAAWMVLAAVVIGVVAAETMGSSFEAESATLTGTTRPVENSQASGGKYMVLESNPGGSSSSPGGSGSSKKSGGGSSSGSSGGSQSGSGSSSGGSTASSCALPKYPTASCTGVPSGWTPKTTINGDLVITQSGRIVEDYLVTGIIDVRASNVTIKRTRVYGKIDNFITNTIYGHLTIEDSEVVLPPGQTVSDNYESAIGVSNYTCKRCKVVGRAEGWRVGASSYAGAGNVTIEDSYAKLQVTQAQCDAVDPHGDGIQGYGGNFATIRHNTIDQRDDPCPTAPIFIPDQDNDGANVIDNVLAGGGYSLRLFGGSFPTVTGNKIVANTWGYGPIDVDCGVIGTWSGNAVITFDFATGTILSQTQERNDC
jgi:uncharacterized membrane protein YgcG